MKKPYAARRGGGSRRSRAATASVAAGFCLALAGCVDADRPRAHLGNGPRIGEPLPAFEVTDLGGQPYDLARLRGRAVLLNLWATWCFPCREEMPELEALQARYAPSTLTVVGISVDAGDPAEVVAFLEENGYTYLNLRADLEPVIEALDIDPGIPHTLLVDRNGIVRGYWRGRFRPFEPNAAELLRSVAEPDA